MSDKTTHVCHIGGKRELGVGQKKLGTSAVALEDRLHVTRAKPVKAQGLLQQLWLRIVSIVPIRVVKVIVPIVAFVVWYNSLPAPRQL